jgi:adenine-specific DNA glycosylase
MEDRVKDLPAVSRRSPATSRRFAAFVLERRGRVLVRQRPEGVLNAFLWEFPNIEIFREGTDIHKAARKEFGVLPVLQPFCSIKHTITRYRITLDVFRGSLRDGSAPPLPGSGRWLTQTELQRLPFTSAHKKVLLKLHAQEPSPV